MKELQLLRELVVKELGGDEVLETFDALTIETKLVTLFEDNIEKLWMADWSKIQNLSKTSREKWYKKNVNKRIASSDFKKVYFDFLISSQVRKHAEGFFTDNEIWKLLPSSRKTIIDFLLGHTNEIDTKYRDFYAFCLNKRGYIDFINGIDLKKYSNVNDLINFIDNQTDNSILKSMVSLFLEKEYGEDFIIEKDKRLKGISNITRKVDFYLLSRSSNVKIEWTLDCIQSDTNLELELIESVLAKQRDCRIHKSGIITTKGFDEFATRYGLDNKMFLAVMPISNTIEFVSPLRGIKQKSDFISMLYPKDFIQTPCIPSVLKRKALGFYFNLTEKEMLNADFEISQIKN